MPPSSVQVLLDQAIRLEAVASEGRLVTPLLVARRDAGLAARLVGRPVDEVPSLLSGLFPLCGTAHAVAGAMALEAALAIEPSAGTTASRALMLLVEHATALGWRLAMDWPPLLGAAPAIPLYAAIRQAAARVAAAIRWNVRRPLIEAPPAPDLAVLTEAMAALCRALGDVFPDVADPAMSWPELYSALLTGTSVPAQAIRIARTGPMAEYGGHGGPMLGPRDAAWYGDRLAADPNFGNQPACDGVPAEVGALAARRHPLVPEALSRWGPVLATRLLAAALDVPAVASRLRAAAEAVADGGARTPGTEPEGAPIRSAVDRSADSPVDPRPSPPNRGAGLVETARGPLAYFTTVADGRLAQLRNVAPTEWNFHPTGPFMTAIAAAPKVPDPAQAARWLAASFDPCVPFRIGPPSKDADNA